MVERGARGRAVCGARDGVGLAQKLRGWAEQVPRRRGELVRREAGAQVPKGLGKQGSREPEPQTLRDGTEPVPGAREPPAPTGRGKQVPREPAPQLRPRKTAQRTAPKPATPQPLQTTEPGFSA